jgi:site-specific DNA-methyltransferase (adenine-specific)
MKIHHGNNIDILKTYDANSFDSIITDPPYGIEFLGKDWDKNTGAVETWQECLRVLKPGGHLLAFSAARTYHNLASNIENVGFEIRDQLMWLYASGFTKAQQIKGQEGWKTCLKPAHEPIVMARKPFKGSTYANMDKYGVGGLNIDATRLESEPYEYCADVIKRMTYSQSDPSKWNDSDKQMIVNNKGKFPMNVLGEVEGYQKYFYCPKVSRAERHIGFYTEDIPTNPDAMYVKDENGKCGERYEARVEQERTVQGAYTQTGTLKRMKDKMSLSDMPKPFQVKHGFDYRMPSSKNEDPNAQVGVVEKTNIGNNHPTVKPVELMKWLIKLVTPKNGTVLDPFTGSGSTGMACVELNYNFVGCEMDAKYVEIAKTRIQGWQTLIENKKPKETVDNTFDRLFEYENR